MDAYSNMGAAYYEMGNYAEAADVLEKALLIDPSFTMARAKLARVHIKSGRTKDGLEELGAVAGDPGADFDTLMLTAEIYGENGMYDKALPAAVRARGRSLSEAQRARADELAAKIKGVAAGG